MHKGWLNRFRKRHSLCFRSIQGESKSVDLNVVRNWLDTEWKDLIQRYRAEDIFNADETGLFYRCLPNKTYDLKSMKCSGGKVSKGIMYRIPPI